MLTAKQHQVYKFIRKFINENSYAPTTAEIALGIAIKSRGVVYRYLQALESAKLIELVPGKRRNINLLVKDGIPLVGRIAAGLPIEAINETENLDILQFFVGEGRYALEVKGDSMIDEGIFDGDIVVCQETTTATNNQIVVALIDNESATLKKFKRNSNNTITLIPANSQHEPQTYFAGRVKIQGIFVGLLRLAHR